MGSTGMGPLVMMLCACDLTFPQSTVQLQCTIRCRPSGGHGVPIIRDIHSSCFHYLPAFIVTSCHGGGNSFGG